MPKSNQTNTEEWYLLHRLWSQAVDKEGYNKEDWMKLEKVILEYEDLKKDHLKSHQ